MSFFTELKRRNVFRVGAAYLVVAWLLIQVVDTLGDMFAMPEAFGRGVVILLGIGFPVALIVSWVFELTAQGLQTQTEADQSGLHTSNSKLNTVIISGLALALIMVVLDAYVLNETPSVNTENAQMLNSDNGDALVGNQEKTIAVLPFANLSSDPEQEYFSDGLTEELINKLSNVSDLLVTGRNSSFYYKDRNEELRDIGETLGVAYVLQGGVRKAGIQVRISAQLMDTVTNANLWSDTFDRDMSDIFAIQDEIATAITTALSITIRAGEFNRPGMTGNLEAYDAFLKAREAYHDFSEAGTRDSIEYGEAAVRLDPDFLDGWILLEDIYDQARFLSPVDLGEQYLARRDEAQDRVRAMDPDSLRIPMYELDGAFEQGGYIETEEILLAVLDLTDESDARVLTNYANLLARVGRMNEALTVIQKARRLDPLDPSIILDQVSILTNLGRFNEADISIEQGLVLGGRERALRGYRLWKQLHEANSPEIIISAFEEQQEIDLPEILQAARLWQQGNRDSALSLVEQYMRDESNAVFNRGVIGIIPVAMGEYQFVLDMVPVVSAVSGQWMPIFSEGRKLPAFKEYLRQRGVVDYWRATGNWGDYCQPLEGTDDFECE